MTNYSLKSLPDNIQSVAQHTATQIGNTCSKVSKVFFVAAINESCMTHSALEPSEKETSADSSYYFLLVFDPKEQRSLNEIIDEIECRFSMERQQIVAIAASFTDVHKHIIAGNRFYTTICRPDSLLYDRRDGLTFECGSDVLSQGSASHYLAEHWKDNFGHACHFLNDGECHFDQENFRHAIFMFHKAVTYFMIASIYHAIQFPATAKMGLLNLYALTLMYSQKISDVFPCDSTDEQNLVHILNLADEENWWKYDVSSRRQEIGIILDRVKVLKTVVAELYRMDSD